MIIARQSTARTVMVGPVLDADGVAVVDGVVGDFKISKNGGVPAALNGSATLTHRHTGHYSLALTASDLDTVGQAEVLIDDTVNACPTKEITVIEEAPYDMIFAASALGYIANAPVNVAQISGDSTAADNLETAYDDTAGSVPWVGILDQGTAQSATATTIVLRAAASFADDTLIGATIVATGSTQGYSQARVITDYDSATDTATVATWAVTPSGTITYKIHGSAPGASTVDANVTQWAGTSVATPSVAGVPEVDVTHYAGSTTDVSTIPASVAAILVDTGTTLQAELDGIQAKTDNLPADPADASDLAAAFGTVNTKLDTIDDFLDTEIAAIKAKTDQLTFTTANQVDAQALSVATGAITAAAIAADAIGASELAADAVAEIADQVWDELLAGHAGAGSAGEALAAAGTAGDPWTTALPGAYGAGTAGKILGDNLNATVSSRATQTSVDTIDGIVDDILVDTGTTLQAELDGIQADTEDIQTRLPAALVAGRMDASVGAMAADVLTAAATAPDFGTEVGTAVWASTTRELTALDEDNTTIDLNATAIGSVVGSVGSVTGNVGGNVVGSVASVTGSVGAIGPAGIAASSFDTGAINAAATSADYVAEINAEVVDALNTDTYAEPGQGTPGATLSLAQKINYLYKAWRNKSTQTSGQYSLFADDATTVDQKASVSDDSTTLTRGEVQSGP